MGSKKSRDPMPLFWETRESRGCHAEKKRIIWIKKEGASRTMGEWDQVPETSR